MKCKSGVSALLCLLAMALGASAADMKIQRPSVVLSPQRVQVLRGLAAHNDARYVRLRAEGLACLHSAAGEYMPPGPSRSGWAGAAKTYALLYLMESDAAAAAAFGDEAAVYMEALIEDLYKVGDRLGGGGVLSLDGGYSIRYHGAALATAYDWLHGYEGFTLDLKTRCWERLNQWIDWYEGRNGSPGGTGFDGPVWSTEYVGYFATKALTAVATYSDNPRARIRYMHEVVTEFDKEVMPAFEKNLAGGYPPEGWGTCCGLDLLTDTVITLGNATGELYRTDFFEDVVHAIIHSTKPDRLKVYDGGSWRGPVAGHPLPLTLMARLSRLLADTRRGGIARYYLVDFARPQGGNVLIDAESLVYLDLGFDRFDFTLFEPLGYFSRGAGMAFFRNSWQEGAFWGSFQSGSPHLVDRQHFDQGHFTLSFLGRDLVIDAGVPEPSRSEAAENEHSYATERHNTIVIDDLGSHSGLSQGPHGERKAVAFEIGNDYVYARADILGAYGFPIDGGESNLAGVVEREVFFVKPCALVVMDRVEPVDEGFPRSVIFHYPRVAQPTMNDLELTAVVPPAELKVFTVSPERSSVELHKVFGMREEDRAKDVYTWAEKTTFQGAPLMTKFVTLFSVGIMGDEESRDAWPTVSPYSYWNGFVALQGLGRFVVVGRAENPRGRTHIEMPVYTVVDLYVTGLAPNAAYKINTQISGVAKIDVIPVTDGIRASPAGVLGVRLNLRRSPERIVLTPTATVPM